MSMPHIHIGRAGYRIHEHAGQVGVCSHSAIAIKL